MRNLELLLKWFKSKQTAVVQLKVQLCGALALPTKFKFEETEDGGHEKIVWKRKISNFKLDLYKSIKIISNFSKSSYYLHLKLAFISSIEKCWSFEGRG